MFFPPFVTTQFQTKCPVTVLNLFMEIKLLSTWINKHISIYLYFLRLRYFSILRYLSTTYFFRFIFDQVKYKIVVTSHDHAVAMCVHSCFHFLVALWSRPLSLPSTNQSGRFCFVGRLLTEVATIPQLRQTTSVLINKVNISRCVHVLNMRNVISRYYCKVELMWEHM